MASNGPPRLFQQQHQSTYISPQTTFQIQMITYKKRQGNIIKVVANTAICYFQTKYVRALSLHYELLYSKIYVLDLNPPSCYKC